MKRLDILVDADDCIFDTLPAFIKAYNDMVSLNEHISEHDITDWDFKNGIKYPEYVDEIFNDDSFFYGLPLKIGAKQTLKEINEDHNIYIVTAGSPKAILGKALSFKLKLPFISEEQIIYGWNKGLYKADIMIDDRVLYHNQFRTTNPDGKSILFDVPHNREVPFQHYRVKDWYMVYEIIDNISRGDV